jgi:hypothetical protein
VEKYRTLLKISGKGILLCFAVIFTATILTLDPYNTPSIIPTPVKADDANLGPDMAQDAGPEGGGGGGEPNPCAPGEFFDGSTCSTLSQDVTVNGCNPSDPNCTSQAPSEQGGSSSGDAQKCTRQPTGSELAWCKAGCTTGVIVDKSICAVLEFPVRTFLKHGLCDVGADTKFENCKSYCESPVNVPCQQEQAPP